MQSSQHLALKVEGAVVQHYKPARRPLRKVHSVCLVVTSVLQGIRAPGPDANANRVAPDQRIERRVQPRGDYFSTQLPLGFSDPGIHAVTVEASVSDEGGTEWKTGPKVTVLVRSVDESNSQQRQQQTRAQPAPQHNVYGGHFSDG